MIDYKLVPVEPTEAMVKEGDKYGITENIWEAMLSAAPEPVSDPVAPVVGEPVGWLVKSSDKLGRFTILDGASYAENIRHWEKIGWSVEPLYTQPDPKLDVAVKALDRMVQLYESECDPENVKRPDWLVEALAQIKGGA